MVKSAVKFWWQTLLTIFPSKEARKSPRNFAGSSPPISPKTSPTSLWKSLVLRKRNKPKSVGIDYDLSAFSCVCVWCILSAVFCFPLNFLEMFQRPLTLILLQRHRDINRRRSLMQSGDAHMTYNQLEGIVMPEHRDTSGRCIANACRKCSDQGSV